MKKSLLLIGFTIGLTGCAAPQEPQLSITPQPQLSSAPIVANLPLKLESRDLRTAQFVAVVDNGRAEVKPIHATSNLRLALQDALARQLSSQGFKLTDNSHTHLRVDLLEALVNVKHSMFSHDIATTVQLQLVAQINDDKFVKRYRGKSNSDGPMSASQQDMEQALNQLLEAVLKDIANDKQLLTFLGENKK